MNQKQREYFCKQVLEHRRRIKNELRAHFRKTSPPFLYDQDIDPTHGHEKLDLKALDSSTQRKIKECWAAYNKLCKKWNGLIKDIDSQRPKLLQQEAAALSKLDKTVNGIVSELQLCNDADEIKSLMSQLPSMADIT